MLVAPTVGRVPWTYKLAPESTSVADARNCVRDLLADDVDDEFRSRVELVVSELVTNSVRHGPGDKPITLRLEMTPDMAVSGEVEDQGDGVVEIRRQDVGTVVGGLGLPIVDQLTSAWGVYPGSTHVWFRIDR